MGADRSQSLYIVSLMLDQNALQASQIHEIEERSAAIPKRKSRKRKLIRQHGNIGHGNAAAQEAAQSSAAPQRSRKLVVVVAENQPNQLYGAVKTAAGLSATHVRANRGKNILD
jgi:hypothetical protein